MFTGIVLGVAPIVHIKEKFGIRTHIFVLPEAWLQGLLVGASIACDGCCLTVTKIAGTEISVEIIPETLRTTHFSDAQIGTLVNIERSLRWGEEVGGHLLSGHISGLARLTSMITREARRELWFTIPKSCQPYLLHKGFIALDGVSLTIGECFDDQFSVHLIPETLKRSTLGNRRIDEMLNVEVDQQVQSIVDTTERFLETRYRVPRRQRQAGAVG